MLCCVNVNKWIWSGVSVTFFWKYEVKLVKGSFHYLATQELMVLMSYI